MIGDSLKKKTLPRDSILFKIDKFYNNKTLTKVEGINKEFMNKNTLTKVLMKKICLPRNVCFDYKRDNKDKHDLIRQKPKFLPKMEARHSSSTSEDKFDILKDYLDKKEKINKSNVSKYDKSGSKFNMLGSYIQSKIRVESKEKKAAVSMFNVR
jgi:hypothetical protein